MIARLSRPLSAFLAIALLCGVPCAFAAPVAPTGPQADLVKRYLGALHAKAYPQAFAMLSTKDQRYFRSADNFASVFAADEFTVDSFALASARASGDDRVIFVKETNGFLDHARQAHATAVVTVPVGVVKEGAAFRIHDDVGKPWRAYRPAAATVTGQNTTYTVRKVSYYERRIELVLNVQNRGTGFVDVLPYGRTVLKDNLGGIYRPLDTKDWRLTDRQFFLGLHLAEAAQYTGVLNFQTARLDDAKRILTMTLGPSLREGSDAPFDVDFAAF